MTRFLASLYAFKFFDSFILIFPLYAAMFVDAGLSPVQISIVLIAWSVTAFVLQIPSGVLADRWPRRAVLIAAQLAWGAGFAVWLAWPHFWGFLAGLVLWGIKSALTSGTFEALLYDELKAKGRAEDYTRIYGRTRAVQAFAVVLAALGAAATARYGYRLELAASLASIALAVASALSLPAAARARVAGDRDYLLHLRQGLELSLREPVVLSILIFGAIVVALGGGIEEFWPIFGIKVGLTRTVIAVFVGVQNGAGMLASLVAHRIARLSTRRLYGLFTLAGLMLAAAAGLFSAPAMLLLIAYSGLLKMIEVVFEGRLQHAIPSDRRATIGSVKGFAGEVGVTGLYLLFGPVAQAISYRAAFLACGGAGVVIGLGYLAMARRPSISH
ncbi:MAG TPA: MFS transporter [Caulobacteraceae bacterium]|jgi:MFS family permease|nr:MFS transporter [Caulobacteraceae bacterium]